MRLTRRDICASALLLPAMAKAQTPPDPRVLEARAGSLRLLPAPAAETPVWGIDGATPGPVLRVKRGEEFRAKLLNKLSQPLALHFHGARLPNAMDGADGLTQAAIAPGGALDYRFTPGDSGTCLYRPSAHPFAAEQNARGLFGALIVAEDAPVDVDHDVLLMLSDWKLDDKGAHGGRFLDPEEVRGEGRIGSHVTVGAKPIPETMALAPGARVRLRVVNACNARMAGVIVEGASPLVIAIDGQPCDAFAPVNNTIPVGPAARFDLMLDLPAKAGEEARVLLRGGGLRADQGGEENRPLLVLRAEGNAAPTRGPITSLPANPRLPAEIRLQNARRVDLTIEATESKDPRQAFTVNGVSYTAKAKPLFTAPRGQVVSLGFLNRAKVAQSLHLHGHHMRVLHLLDDGWEPYWRDCVIVPPGRTVRVAFIADNPGKWLIDSPVLEHAAGGVGAWFEIR